MNDFYSFLLTHTFFLYGLFALLGLIIGSFLNVVIHRFPLILKQQWQQECSEFMGLPQNTPLNPIKISLSTPASHCPHCTQAIAIRHNIPVLSYLFLKGRCANCKHPISLRYPLVEILACTLSLVAVYFCGLSWMLAAALIFTYVLICLAFIDLQHQLLPDILTLPLLWLGLLVSIPQFLTDSHAAILGAAFGYLSLWSFAKLFKLIRGKEGMGHGDFKLLAVFGAWLGWQILPLIILLSALLGSIGGLLTLQLSQQDKSTTPIPFGPYLAIAGWIAFYWGQEIMQKYLIFLN